MELDVFFFVCVKKWKKKKTGVSAGLPSHMPNTAPWHRHRLRWSVQILHLLGDHKMLKANMNHKDIWFRDKIQIQLPINSTYHVFCCNYKIHHPCLGDIIIWLGHNDNLVAVSMEQGASHGKAFGALTLSYWPRTCLGIRSIGGCLLWRALNQGTFDIF